MIFLKRTILSGLLLLMILNAAVAAVEIEGVTFAETEVLDGTELQLKGTAVLTWALLFDVYAGAFYLPADQPGEKWNDDLPKILELSYFREIAAEDFAASSDQLLRENLDAEDYRSLQSRLQTLYALFEDVAPGDRYRLVYAPGQGTQLQFNGQPLGSIPGADFAVAYFGIWLGEAPINEDFRDRLLGLR